VHVCIDHGCNKGRPIGCCGIVLCSCSSEILKGQVAWVTGASSGIGKHVAYELARVDCKLVLSARSTDELEKVRKECLSLYYCTFGMYSFLITVLIQ